jgi:hypothetical protein
VVRFVAVVAALIAVVVFVAACGSSSGSSSTSSSVSLPEKSGDPELSATYTNYYKELTEGGATPKTARCYVKLVETLPAEELEELFTPGELSKTANERLFEFNAEAEEKCVGKGGPFKANASREEQEGTIKQLAVGLASTLEAKGVPSETISCVQEGAEALSYKTLIEVTKHEPAGTEALGRVGEECNLSLPE